MTNTAEAPINSGLPTSKLAYQSKRFRLLAFKVSMIITAFLEQDLRVYSSSIYVVMETSTEKL